VFVYVCVRESVCACVCVYVFVCALFFAFFNLQDIQHFTCVCV